MRALLRQWSWPEVRHQPWRHAAALLAVMLGVALAFSVHLINASALGEFSAAVRSVNGEADFVLKGPRDGFDESLYERVSAHPGVALASPVVDVDAWATDAAGKRVALRVLGLDALVAPAISPSLAPRAASAPAGASDRFAAISPDAVFVNAGAGLALGTPSRFVLQTPTGPLTVRVAGDLQAGGAPLAVMDIAGVQTAFGRVGRLDRIDVRLAAGHTRDDVLASLALPPGVVAADPADAAQRISNVSRAYRVNLTVLALVALFTGSFLVFSILSLSVSRRQSQFALLGVLGMTARERLSLVVAESALLGVAGSVLGLAAGTGLAAAALRLLSGDLGGGYFPGVTPQLQFSAAAAAAYGALGTVAAVVGGWVPARAAQRLVPAQALKGLGRQASRARRWPGPFAMALGVALALLPPVGGLPIAAYASVALLLLGGIACVPAVLGALLSALPATRHPLAMLAFERARHQRQAATVAVAGVVASLSLAVALTVMVASFRDAVTQWLDTVLPADLYLRVATGAGADGTRRGGDLTTLPATFVQRAASVPGVLRAEAQRQTQVSMSDARPPVALVSRPLADPARELPLTGELLPLPSGETAAYVSEAMVDLYGARPGTRLQLPMPDGTRTTVYVRAVWRDYARQHGAVMLHEDAYRRLTGDDRINDVALWLVPGTDAMPVQQALRALATADADAPLEFSSPGQIRTLTLRIFDRSFAVTYWLQAVAIAIGLFGIAASGSAQVLARRKEFGLLSHLGLTRRQVLGIVAMEGAVCTAVGTVIGLALGIAVSVVLVKVVNPQSFHWSMDLLLPWTRLVPLCAAVLLAGTLAAWASARRAASRQMALAVKEDW